MYLPYSKKPQKVLVLRARLSQHYAILATYLCAKGQRIKDPVFLHLNLLIMKEKILSLAALSIVLLSCGSPQPATSTTTTAHEAHATVPAGINTTFMAQYPTATNVVWSPYDQVTIPIDWEFSGWTAMDAGDYVARFDMDGQKYYAWYDAAGDWIGTAVALSDPSALPQAVKDLLSTKYSGYSVVSVQREIEKSRTAYEIKLKKTDDDKIKLLVDENGAVLKEKLKD